MEKRLACLLFFISLFAIAGEEPDPDEAVNNPPPQVQEKIDELNEMYEDMVDEDGYPVEFRTTIIPPNTVTSEEAEGRYEGDQEASNERIASNEESQVGDEDSSGSQNNQSTVNSAGQRLSGAAAILVGTNSSEYLSSQFGDQTNEHNNYGNPTLCSDQSNQNTGGNGQCNGTDQNGSGSGTSAPGGEFDTEDVIDHTVDAMPSCLEYQVLGICYFLTCYGVYCDITTSYHVTHFLPDLVTTGFSTAESNPWDIYQKNVDPIYNEAGNYLFELISATEWDVNIKLTDGEKNMHGNDSVGMRLRHSDVIGNPVIISTNSMSDYFLRSNATPFALHYHSTLDSWPWRNQIWESLLTFWWSWVPFVKEVGSGLNSNISLPSPGMSGGGFNMPAPDANAGFDLSQMNIWSISIWGNHYPRGGFLNQANNIKAVSVAASRGAGVATSPFFFDALRSPMPAIGCSNDACRPPGPAHPGNPRTKWQRIWPYPTQSCPLEITNQATPAWAKRDTDSGKPDFDLRNAAFVVWRKYSGCLPGTGVFLYTTGVDPVPIK